MAAGSAGASGRSSGSSPALESTLDRRFQTLNNTMESIQGLSVWCIENKKYHSFIVRYWLKWMRKSDPSQRLNLFFLANDVIQNCKRKNAIVYRTTFTDVLPESIKLISAVKDNKVTKSVERILTIWEDRSVYSEELIRQLKSGLVRAEEPTKVPAPDNSKADLKSKIVAEFVPSAFIEHLSKYRKSMDEIDLKEKQLASMRVDVCSTEALKKLKDKAGGKRFSKDFEDGSTKLQDFVSFLDGEVKKGPPLVEALENADIFYEMQYKEVKIVAKAYETFANRVSHLKRKLDSLKAMLPDPNDSPVPSPIEDAPSPTGSESPFHTLGKTGEPDPDLDGQEMEDDMIDLVDAPSPLSSVGGSPKPSISAEETDNRDVEDMELSDVEDTETPAIIVEENVAQTGASKQPSSTQNITETSPPNETAQTIQVTNPTPPVSSATPSLPVNLAGVDLGKISSILSTLTNVMKNTGVGVSPVSRSSASVPSTPSSTLKSPMAAAPPTNPLANILSRVDINTNTLLSALSKTQPQVGLQGFSSLLSNQAAKAPANDSDKSPLTPLTSLVHESSQITPTSPTPFTTDSGSQACTTPRFSQSDTVNEKMNLSPSLNSTLDLKIDNFIHGNPGLKSFNMGFPSVLTWPKSTVDIPLAGADNLVGTPVRDEAGSTPTQDEIMDVPGTEPSVYQQGPPGSTDTKSTHSLASWQDPNSHTDPRVQSRAEIHQNVREPKMDLRNSLPSISEAEAKRHQHIEAMLSTSNPSNQQSSDAKTRPGPKHQDQRQNLVICNTGPNTELSTSNLYPYQDQDQQVLTNSDGYGAEQYRVQESRQNHSRISFFTTPLPPIPTLPPPPPAQDFSTPVSSSRAGGSQVPSEKSYSESEVGVGDKSYIHENSGYDEHLTHKEPFHPNRDGPSHFTQALHNVPKVPSNSSVDYNHQYPPRAPQPHPSHQQHGSPSQGRGYHEGLSPPRHLPNDPYFDSYYDHPSRSPSPPRYDTYSASPQAHEYYSEDVPPHYPERRVPPPHLEHRPRPPHPVRLPHPHPGHYQPPRPLRRPPPVPYAYEPPFPRGKRPGPPYGGPPRSGGPFFPPKRPFMPPHY